MILENEVQRALICRAICEKVGLSGFWTAEGPTEKSLEAVYTHFDNDDGEEDARPTEKVDDFDVGASSGQLVMLGVAWSFWNGHPAVSLFDMAHRLDANNRRCIAELLTLDSGLMWLTRWDYRDGL